MAKVGDKLVPSRAQWPWGSRAQVREKLVTRSELDGSFKPTKLDPKFPPLPSDLLVKSLKNDGGTLATRLSVPMAAVAEMASEVQLNQQEGGHRRLMRRFLRRAVRSRKAVEGIVDPSDLAALPPTRRAEYEEALERENALLEHLEELGDRIDEIIAKSDEEKSRGN